MGGIEEVRDQDFTAWTGGKPKADWSGLEDPGAERTNIYQQRPTAGGAGQKSQASWRVKGLTT
eukprot:scaffold14973_cov83-Cylindrotheca_fusiformis.AAC.1